jgi:hypothetical protein
MMGVTFIRVTKDVCHWILNPIIGMLKRLAIYVEIMYDFLMAVDPGFLQALCLTL